MGTLMYLDADFAALLEQVATQLIQDLLTGFAYMNLQGFVKEIRKC